MKPITINLTGKFVDGYIYLGRLFLVGMDGTISSISMDELVSRVSEESIFGIMKIAFLRSDWVSNIQGKNFFKMPYQVENFKNTWRKISNIDFYLDIDKLKESKHFQVPDAPIFDVRAYGLKLYLGNRNGLYESQILNRNDEFENIKNPRKIFDARTIFVSAKSGELIVSSNSDGLFRGRVGAYDDISKINENSIAKKSVRTGWNKYDVLNYESQNKFVYYVNEVEKSEDRPRVPYSIIDESTERKRITKFGVVSRTQEELLANKFEDDPIKYSFNSLSSCFFLTSNNDIYKSSFKKSQDNFRLSSRIEMQSRFDKILSLGKTNKFISTAIIPSGIAIETISSVVISNVVSKPVVLHKHPIYGMKTFMSSRRFKNVFIVFHENGVSIHAIFPVDLSQIHI